MHQTTVRFTPELWQQLAAEASQLGVSAAQFVRDATLARIAYAQGRHGDPHYEAALAYAAAPSGRIGPDARRLEAGAESTAAVAAQSRLARTRSREIREHAATLREQRRARQKTAGAAPEG